MPRYQPLDLHDAMPFGQYEGSTIAELTELDAPYLLWLLERKGVNFFTKTVEDVLTERKKEMGWR